jgi:uncharacterized protein (TIGR02231 family)
MLKHTLPGLQVKATLISLLCVTGLVASEITSNKIDSVIVYPDSAQIARQLSLRIDANDSTVSILGLPSSLVESSVRIEWLSAKAPILKKVRILRNTDWEENTEVIQLRSEMESIDRAIESLKVNQNRIQRQIMFAEKLITSFAEKYGSPAIQAGELTSRDPADVWAYAEPIFTQLPIELLALNDQAKELQDKKQKVNESMRLVRERLAQQESTIECSLLSREIMDAELRVLYLVPDATWTPYYDLQADIEHQKLQINLIAEISQRSGEDWKDVSLTLSSQSGDREGNLPVLKPIHLSQNTPVPQFDRQARAKQAVSIAFEAVGSFSAGVSADERYESEATPVRNFTSFEMKLGGRQHLLTGNEPVRLDVISHTLEAAYWSETVPALQTRAYLRAECKNTTDFIFLAGEAMAYIERKLQARVNVPYVIPGETLKLSLGEDEAVKVERKTLLFNRKETGLIDKTVVLQRHYQTLVTNRHTTAHRIKVQDRFPLSRDNKIQIENARPTEKEITLDPETGIFSWDRQLNPAQTQEFDTAFEVVHPREWVLPQQF